MNAVDILVKYFKRFAVIDYGEGSVAVGLVPYTPYTAFDFCVDAYYVASNTFYQKGRSMITELNGAGIRATRAPAETPLKTLALQAGLVFQGLNSLTYSGEFGSRFYIYAVSLPRTPAFSTYKESRAECLRCGACVKACPVQMTDDKSQMTDKGTGHKARGAGEGQIINNSNCEQYMSSENCVRAAMDSPANMSNAMSAAAGTRLWGCDVCQRVCPHNNEVVIEPPDPLARAARELIFTGDMSVLAGYIGANHARKKRLLNLAANAAGNTGDRAYLPPLQKLGQNPDYALNAQRAIEKIERGKPF